MRNFQWFCEKFALQKNICYTVFICNVKVLAGCSSVSDVPITKGKRRVYWSKGGAGSKIVICRNTMQYVGRLGTCSHRKISILGFARGHMRPLLISSVVLCRDLRLIKIVIQSPGNCLKMIWGYSWNRKNCHWKLTNMYMYICNYAFTTYVCCMYSTLACSNGRDFQGEGNATPRLP